MNWSGNASRLPRGTARLATMRIRAVRLQTRFVEVASYWGGMDRGFARTTGSNVGAPTLKVILEGLGRRVEGESVAPPGLAAFFFCRPSAYALG